MISHSYTYAFIAYFTIIFSIAYFSYKKMQNDADYIVGSRSLNFWVTALSAHASDMSAWLFMGLPAAVFMGGPSQMWIAIGLVAGMFLNWKFVAVKLRKYTEATNSYTLSTFFENRFEDRSGTLRILTAVASLIFLTCYLAAGLIAIGLLLESIFGMNYHLGLSLAMVVMVVYTFTGGYITIAWMDLFQGLFLLFVIATVPILAFASMPEGWTAIEIGAENFGINMELMPEISFTSIFTIISLALGWGLGYFGQPHIITKFMGIKDPKDLKKSMIFGISWQVATLCCSVLIGLIGIGFFSEVVLQNPELVFVEIVKDLLPPFIGGFILCGVLAANMSTMDSQMLVCASVLSEDLYKHLKQKEPTQKQLLHFSRFGVLLVAVASILIALYRSSTVLETVLYAWSGLGSAFGPLVLMSLYSKQANKYGAVAGIIVGALVAGLWEFMHPSFTSIDIPAMIPGFFSSLFSIWFVSKIMQKGSPYRDKGNKKP